MHPQLLPKVLTMQWLMSASGSYSRASRKLMEDIKNSDLDDVEMCRIYNDRIMTVRPRLEKFKKNIYCCRNLFLYACLNRGAY